MAEPNHDETDPPEALPNLHHGNPHALEYATAGDIPAQRWIRVLAHVTAVYPLFVLGSLYGQWLLSWWVLGHVPRPSLDDPKHISGASWMHLITFFAILGLVPACLGALVCNMAYTVGHERKSAWIAFRFFLVVALWIGTFILLRWDPARVGYWWID